MRENQPVLNEERRNQFDVQIDFAARLLEKVQQGSAKRWVHASNHSCHEIPSGTLPDGHQWI